MATSTATDTEGYKGDGEGGAIKIKSELQARPPSLTLIENKSPYCPVSSSSLYNSSSSSVAL